MHVKVEYFLDIQDKKKNTSLLDIPLRKKLVNFQDHADQQLNYKRLISLLLFYLYGYVKILTLDKLGKLNCRISQSACFFRSTVVEYISYIMSLCQFVILIWQQFMNPSCFSPCPKGYKIFGGFGAHQQ